MKSGWPGVSTTLTVVSPTGNATTAALMVMPRWRSRANASVWVVPESTDPGSSMTPARCRSLSVSVVLPASTWARMPRLSERAGMRDPLRVATEELGVRACCSHLRAISWDQWPGLPVSVTIRRATRRSPTLFLRASSGIGKQSRLRRRPRTQLPGAAEDRTRPPLDDPRRSSKVSVSSTPWLAGHNRAAGLVSVMIASMSITPQGHQPRPTRSAAGAGRLSGWRHPGQLVQNASSIKQRPPPAVHS